MKKSNITEGQILLALKQGAAAQLTADVFPLMGISD
jgi:hypothetical protein